MNKNYKVYYFTPENPQHLEQWLEGILRTTGLRLLDSSGDYWIFEQTVLLDDSAIELQAEPVRRDKQTSEHLNWMAEQGNTITGLRNELKECYEMIARMKKAGDDLIQLANYKNKRAIEYIYPWSALMKELEKRKWVK
jgi:hypothetical protein